MCEDTLFYKKQHNFMQKNKVFRSCLNFDTVFIKIIFFRNLNSL